MCDIAEISGDGRYARKFLPSGRRAGPSRQKELVAMTSRSHIVVVGCFTALIAGCQAKLEQDLAEASVTSALQTSRSSRMSRIGYEKIEDQMGCLDPAAAV